MKALFIVAVAVASISFSACNGSNNSAKENNTTGDSAAMQTSEAGTAMKSTSTPLKELTAAYIQIKNGLTSDNGTDAAAGGKAFNEALAKVDTSSMSAEQKKSFEDIADDAKEMAEHISTNARKIAHQREHFDMLSQDMYDMVKTFGTGQILYQDFCPMYNNGKGATWLSEVKLIRNPYLGKKMPTCGSVKETIQ